MEKTFLVGIAGGSAGGKSTFAGKLTDSLKGLSVKSISMDDYFKPAQERRETPAVILKDRVYRDDNHPTSFNLTKMKEDMKTLTDSAEYDVLILEGLLTLWDDEILNLLDLKLFVDCRADERIVRRIRRNMTWGLSFDEISDVYLDLVRFRHDTFVEPTKWRADMIVNGASPFDRSLEMVSLYIRNAVDTAAL